MIGSLKYLETYYVESVDFYYYSSMVYYHDALLLLHGFGVIFGLLLVEQYA